MVWRRVESERRAAHAKLRAVAAGEWSKLRGRYAPKAAPAMADAVLNAAAWEKGDVPIVKDEFGVEHAALAFVDLSRFGKAKNNDKNKDKDKDKDKGVGSAGSAAVAKGEEEEPPLEEQVLGIAEAAEVLQSVGLPSLRRYTRVLNSEFSDDDETDDDDDDDEGEDGGGGGGGGVVDKDGDGAPDAVWSCLQTSTTSVRYRRKSFASHGTDCARDLVGSVGRYSVG